MAKAKFERKKPHVNIGTREDDVDGGVDEDLCGSGHGEVHQL